MTPGTFCKKCVFWTFWWLLGWISAKLPLIRSKMRLQHNSLPFLPPASRFSALWLGHVQKPKAYVFRLFNFLNFFSPLLFPLFSSFCCCDWPCTGFACGQNTSKKASSRGAIFSMEHPGVVAGNFAPSFSLNFWAFLCISKAPFGQSLWSGHHWKDLQKLSIADANFGQKWWRQKRKAKVHHRRIRAAQVSMG